MTDDGLSFQRVVDENWFKEVFRLGPPSVSEEATFPILESFPALVSEDGWTYSLCAHLSKRIFDANAMKQKNLYVNALTLAAAEK